MAIIIGVHYNNFIDVKVGHMTCHVMLCWSTYFLGDISLRNRREIAVM